MIGIRIRELRRQRGWSQEKLGELVGFSQSKISKIENGYCDSLSELKLLAAALDVRLEELVREEEKKNDESTVDEDENEVAKSLFF